MSDDLDVLVIEDNPGDARLIEEMLGDARGFFRRVEINASLLTGTQVHHERQLSDGLERLSEGDVDVVLLDLGLPDSTGLDTLAAVVDSTEFVPIVVLTGLRDEGIGVEALQRGAQDYLVKDEVTPDLLARSIRHAVYRNQQERERIRQLDQLEALNRLNRISQDVTHAVITTTTREDLERTVCERLVESDAYRFAWIGGVNPSTGEITPRVTAGVEDRYFDEATITVGDGATPEGPAGKAVRTRTVQVVQNMQTDPEFEPWREHAIKRGYRSDAAIPVAHENFLYGVLCVYAASPNAFSHPETDILLRLGDIIGHAIAAIERRDALVSDTVLEFEFGAEGIAGELTALSADSGGVIEFSNVVSNGDVLVTYGRINGIPREEFLNAAERTEAVDFLRFFPSEHIEHEFELGTEAFTALVTAVSTHGGHIESASIANGEFRFVVAFPPRGDKHQLIDMVEEYCPRAVPRAQRTVQRDALEASTSHSVLQNRLTEKQRAALETAFFAGFFDWPRASTGKEIADLLGISPATFTQHLRAAERKFFDAVFNDT